jgi:hypothetical protein
MEPPDRIHHSRSHQLLLTPSVASNLALSVITLSREVGSKNDRIQVDRHYRKENDIWQSLQRVHRPFIPSGSFFRLGFTFQIGADIVDE